MVLKMDVASSMPLSSCLFSFQSIVIIVTDGQTPSITRLQSSQCQCAKRKLLQKVSWIVLMSIKLQCRVSATQTNDFGVEIQLCIEMEQVWSTWWPTKRIPSPPHLKLFAFHFFAFSDFKEVCLEQSRRTFRFKITNSMIVINAQKLQQMSF